MPPRNVSLAERYDLACERVLLSGTQAIVRLALMQAARDRAEGLRTAGYVTGYRGSPLAGLDQQLARAQRQLEAAGVRFQPALNEDLAATALWGAQQAAIRGEGRVEGVFGLWYGKGPGIDRSGDAFRHANLAGTAARGGVLVLAGDDHTCESSTSAHQSEFALLDAMIPVLSPAGVQEILDFGLHGLALSRFSGLWVGLKCVKDTVESTAVVDGRPDRVAIRLPQDFPLPRGGLNIRTNDHPLAQEARLHEHKLPAALAYVRANALNRLELSGGRRPRFGIVAAGKSYLDVLEALETLGIDEVRAADLGLRLYKVGCVWPLEPEGVRAFAAGLDLVMVVEEKRSLIESQIKEILYGRPGVPLVVGKRDEEGGTLFAATGALDSNAIAIAIAERALRFFPGEERLAAQLRRLTRLEASLAGAEEIATRLPYFCAGCPHNSSTRVPEGSRAYAGIGCHYMVQWMDRRTEGYTQMGGEGANWVGEAPFSTRRHVFQNLGDGTFNHSGLMAMRAAAAAGVSITYKILYNDAVAMTGGQRNDGELTVDRIAREVAAIGVQRLAVVTDEPFKYPPTLAWPAGTTIHHRSELARIEREMAETEGLTVLIYDQTCAAEKRRRRRRGTYPDPDARLVINERVCEGCGDCGLQSNCVAIQPVETPFGRKRQIDQSACNKDLACLAGFCPAFVTVKGARLRGAQATGHVPPDLGEPPVPGDAAERQVAVLIAGIGGTGVVTLAQVLAMAAHIEGKGAAVIDMAGLAQKGGAVVSHLRIAPSPAEIRSIRVPAGRADLVLGCDLVVAAGASVLAAMDRSLTLAVIDTEAPMPGDFTRNPDAAIPTSRLVEAVQARTRSLAIVGARHLARRLLGDSIAANMILLGRAFEAGALPLSAAAIEQAIALNGADVDMNRAAFRWGRASLAAPQALARALGKEAAREAPETLETLLRRLAADLEAYQDAAYAERFRARIARLATAEAAAMPGAQVLAETAARTLYRLMAIKDEYEVARLYGDGSFRQFLHETFEAYDRLELHLAPPLLAREDPETGRPGKRAFGPWMLRLMPLLARGKRLRGTPLDPFGRTQERRAERALLADYEALIDEIAATLTPANHAAAVALAAWPAAVRGFGPVKAANLARAQGEKRALIARFRAGGPPVGIAAE